MAHRIETQKNMVSWLWGGKKWIESQKVSVMDETYFAPVKRASEADLLRQVDIICKSPFVNSFLDTIAGIIVILNEDRQVVGLNNAFLKSIGVTNPEKSLGLRFGENVGCVHAAEMEGGCGTSKSCGSCGAAIAMMSSLETNSEQTRLCALESGEREEIKNVLLEVKVSPVVLENHRFLVVSVKDVTQEQVRANLERVFYHDMSNILSTMLGPSELLVAQMPDRWEAVQLHESAKRLQKEIVLQRQISQTSEIGFEPERSQVLLSEIGNDVELLMSGHAAARGRTITIKQHCDECFMFTDKMLVSRVLANMLVNALEATLVGGEVQFVTRSENNHVHWEVWNNTFIPEAIQPRIFQRYFSTKSSPGRGLGTFSMKLFGEEYLQGKIKFTSTQESGTLFSFILPKQ